MGDPRKYYFLTLELMAFVCCLCVCKFNSALQSAGELKIVLRVLNLILRIKQQNNINMDA